VRPVRLLGCGRHRHNTASISGCGSGRLADIQHSSNKSELSAKAQGRPRKSPGSHTLNGGLSFAYSPKSNGVYHGWQRHSILSWDFSFLTFCPPSAGKWTFWLRLLPAVITSPFFIALPETYLPILPNRKSQQAVTWNRKPGPHRSFGTGGEGRAARHGYRGFDKTYRLVH
jgi:hypothetical protein